MMTRRRRVPIFWAASIVGMAAVVCAFGLTTLSAAAGRWGFALFWAAYSVVHAALVADNVRHVRARPAC